MLNIIGTSFEQCLILQNAISTLRKPNYLPVIHLNIYAGSTFIFTDGSKTNDSAGCAAIICQWEYSAKLINFASSFTAELIAILLVIKNVLYRHSSNNFTMFTASKSSLVALQNFNPNNPIILNIFYFL